MSERSDVSEFRRGWRPLLASGVGICFGITGITFYSYGVFVVPLMTAFGWTRGQAAFGSSCLIIGTAITAPIVGMVIDRIGARRVAVISVFGVILGYLAMSQQPGSLAIFYLTWLLMAFAGCGSTPVIFTRNINMWFDKGRGLALGLALAGTGVSSIVGPPLCTYLIKSYAWQGGYIGLAVLTLMVAFPLLFVFFKDRPIRAATPTNVSGTLSGLTVGEAVRTVDFWKIALGFVLIAGTVSALVINLVPLLRDRGSSPEAAARIASVMGVAIVIGRICVGYLVDRFRATVVLRAMMSLTAIGCLLLTWDGAPWWVQAISAATFGLAAATEVDLVAFLTSRYFGMKAYGKIYGWQTTAFYIGSASGPAAAGFASDAFKGYIEVLYAAAALLVIGALIAGSLGRPPTFAAIPDGPAEA